MSRNVHLTPEEFAEQHAELKNHHAGMASWGIRESRFSSWMSGVRPDASILEVGAGSGASVDQLMQMGFRNITLCDIDDYRSQENAKRLPFFIWNANVDRLPMADGALDAVIALQVVEHVENVWHAFREFGRVLAVGGRCVISIPYGLSLQSRLRFLFRGNVMGWEYGNDHITFLTEAVWRKLIERSFRLIKTDWSEPFIKIGARKLRLPRHPFWQKLFSRKVAYVLERSEERKPPADWKTFSHIE